MQKRRYALHEKINGKWIRLYGCAYDKATAIRVYQSQLIACFFAGRKAELRPVKDNGGV